MMMFWWSRGKIKGGGEGRGRDGMWDRDVLRSMNSRVLISWLGLLWFAPVCKLLFAGLNDIVVEFITRPSFFLVLLHLSWCAVYLPLKNEDVGF